MADLFGESPPSRKEVQRQQVQTFKALHNVYTHYSPGIENPWAAVMVPADETRTPIAMIAEECCDLENRGLLVYDKTELKAVKQVAVNQDLPHRF